MSGSGKGVLGVVGISWNGSGAGTFPDRALVTGWCREHSNMEEDM